MNMGNVFEEEKNNKGPQVPTIDLREIEAEDEVVRERCRDELKKAVMESGAMHLVNQGVSNELMS